MNVPTGSVSLELSLPRAFGGPFLNHGRSLSRGPGRISAPDIVRRSSRIRAFRSPKCSIRNDASGSPSGLLPTRREALGTGLLASVGLFEWISQGFDGPVARAETTSKIVKLKNVENPKLQAALRAAVAGDLETAEDMFVDLLAEEPESASLWSNLGSVRISLEKFQEASSDLTQAIRLAPYAPVPYLNRAIAFEALGRIEEAVDDCKRAIENDPQEFAAWFNLGNLQTKLQNYEDALKAYERSALLAPGVAGYRLKQTLLLFQVGRTKEAEKLVSGLVRKYPNYSEAHAVLAAIFWNEGQKSKAEEQYSEAVLLNPVFNNKAFLKEQLQWPPKIKQAFQDFLNIA